MGSGLFDTVNMAAVMGGPPITVEVANHRDITQLCMEWKNLKIFEGLSNGKNMVFNVKKLSNGVGLSLRRKGGKKRCKRISGKSSRF
jgi:hypothetical protein